MAGLGYMIMGVAVLATAAWFVSTWVRVRAAEIVDRTELEGRRALDRATRSRHVG